MSGTGFLAALALLCAAAPSSAHESGGCESYTWNVSRELGAMRTDALATSAAIHPAANPAQLVEGVHYTAELRPQDDVLFLAPPAKQARAEKPTAGLLFFRTGRAGLYRISLSSRHWIDVVDGARIIGSRSHQGQGQCKLLHKVVEFEIPAERLLTIQLSGDAAAAVDLVITAVGDS